MNLRIKFLFGSHHKAGTNFFLKFLKDISQELNYLLWERSIDEHDKFVPLKWDIYFDAWSKWQVNLDEINFKGVHSIRDPRSLIYSAMKYHQVSSEKWLHEPLDLLDGKTYAFCLSELKDDSQKLIFEMNHSSKWTIEEMLNSFSDDRFYHIKIEDISRDPYMTSLNEAFEYLGLSLYEKEKWINMAKKHCLWNMSKLPSHSTTGVSTQFEQLFVGEVKKEYKKLFSDVEKVLGY